MWENPDVEKSTIAGILAGRNRGFSGSVTVNGTALEEISEEALMKNVTLIRHNSYLFKGTVEENLVWQKKRMPRNRR